MRQKPKISLCMIVKDEADCLPDCLRSVKDLIDQMVVVDTGSTDRTVEIAERHGAEVHFFPWVDDFAAARNESLRYARGDWILWLDADERLNSAGQSDCLRTAASAPGVDAYSVLISSRRSSNGEVDHDVARNLRFLRNIPGLHFVNEIHERVEPFLEKVGATLAEADFFIEHVGYDYDERTMVRKLERNLRLTQKQLRRTPDDAYTLYYLGFTQLLLGEQKAGEESLNRALQGKGLVPGLRALVLNMLVFCHLSAGDYERALRNAQESLTIAPVQNTARLLIGLIHYQQEAYAEALPFLIESYRFLNTPAEKRGTQLGKEHSFVGKAECVKAIALSYASSGKFAQAVPFFHRYLRRYGNESEMLRLLALCYLNTEDFRSAVYYLKEAERRGAARRILALPMAYAHFRLRQFELADKYYNESDAQNPEEINASLRILEMMAQEPGYAKVFAATCLRKRSLLHAAEDHQLINFMSCLATAGNHLELLHLFEWLPAQGKDFDLLVASVSAALFEKNRIDEVIELLEQLAQRFRDKEVVLENLAVSYIKTQNFRKAIDAYLELLTLAPEKHHLKRRLAGLYIKIGCIDAARQVLGGDMRGERLVG